MVRYATIDDMIAYYGKRPATTAYAVAAVDDVGQVIGIGGLKMGPNGTWVAFSETRVPVSTRDWVRGWRMLAALGVGPLYAAETPALESSPRLLRHFGFEPVGQGAWQWGA